MMSIADIWLKLKAFISKIPIVTHEYSQKFHYYPFAQVNISYKILEYMHLFNCIKFHQFHICACLYHVP